MLWGDSTPRSRLGICYSLSESEMPWSPTLHTSRLRSGQRAETAVAQREGKLLPWPRRAQVGAGGDLSGKGKGIWAEAVPTGLGERDVTHLRDLFAILQVPHRRGLGGDAGQPPPASGECSFSPTLPRRFPRSRSEADRVRNAGPRQGRTEGRRGGPRPAPGPQRCFLAPARPVQGCPQHVSRRAPALSRPLPPPLSLLAVVPARLCRGRRPPPSPRSGQLCRARSLLQGFVRTAESRAQPPSRAAVWICARGPEPHWLWRPHAGGRGRGGESARDLGRGWGAGSRDWNSRESGKELGASGCGRRPGSKVLLWQDPERAERRTRGGGALRAARGLLGKWVPGSPRGVSGSGGESPSFSGSVDGVSRGWAVRFTATFSRPKLLSSQRHPSSLVRRLSLWIWDKPNHKICAAVTV